MILYNTNSLYCRHKYVQNKRRVGTDGFYLFTNYESVCSIRTIWKFCWITLKIHAIELEHKIIKLVILTAFQCKLLSAIQRSGAITV